MSLCLLAAGLLQAKLAWSDFELRWNHSVEKTLWTEHYEVTPRGLVLDDASVEGSGAGMDPPQGAVLRDGAWHYRPDLPPLPSVTLAASAFTADHRLCAAGSCHALHSLVPDAPKDVPITLQACR